MEFALLLFLSLLGRVLEVYAFHFIAGCAISTLIAALVSAVNGGSSWKGGFIGLLVGALLCLSIAVLMTLSVLSAPW